MTTGSSADGVHRYLRTRARETRHRMEKLMTTPYTEDWEKKPQPATWPPPPVEMPWPTIYLGIGNSDNKLTQQEWAEFLRELYDLLHRFPHKIHGWWYSGPAEPWQNAEVGFDLPRSQHADFRAELVALRKKYRQESVSWAEVAEVEFL